MCDFNTHPSIIFRMALSMVCFSSHKAKSVQEKKKGGNIAKTAMWITSKGMIALISEA